MPCLFFKPLFDFMILKDWVKVRVQKDLKKDRPIDKLCMLNAYGILLFTKSKNKHNNQLLCSRGNN